MTDETKPESEVILPAETNEQAFEALMSAVDTGGISEIAYRLLRSPVLFDPSQARANAKAIATTLRKVANQLCDATRPPGQPRVRELYSIHGEAAGIWFCEKCRYTCRNEEDATSCCAPRVCDKCKETLKAGSYFCDPCWSKEQAEKEAARWAKAEPVAAAEYTGEMVYVETEDGHPYGGSHEGYFHSLEDLAECVEDGVYDDEDGAIPTLHVYETTPTRLTFDASSLLDSELEEFHDGARDDVASAAEEELQAFLTDWADKNSPTTYYPDYSRKIVGWETYVSPEREDEEESEDDE